MNSSDLNRDAGSPISGLRNWNKKLDDFNGYCDDMELIQMMERGILIEVLIREAKAVRNEVRLLKRIATVFTLVLGVYTTAIMLNWFFFPNPFAGDV